jgi:hypothetical protein
MKFGTLTLAALFVTGLAGCANQPASQWYPQSQQMQVSAAQHWGLIAADAVEQTRRAISGQAFAAGKPLYVADNTGTHFDRAFRNYMITGLVNAGLPVTPSREGAIEISYETQVIRHGSSIDPSAFGYRPGMATAGVAGFWVLRNASTAGLAAGTIAGAAALDYYNAKKPAGVELLLTTSIVYDDRYRMRNTDAYYLERTDAYLFEPCRKKSLNGCRPALIDIMGK